jgi:hypothetical protein
MRALLSSRSGYITIMVAALAVAAAIIAFRYGDPAEFSDIVHSDDFLAGLREKHGDGCIAMTAMEQVDVIVIGPSVVHASIDARIFARRLAPRATAVCALPGWKISHMDFLFEFLDQENLNPKQIIWMVEPRTMRSTSSALRSTARIRNLLTNRWSHEEMQQVWRAQLDASQTPFEFDADTVNDRTERLSNSLDNLDPATVHSILDRSGNFMEQRLVETMASPSIAKLAGADSVMSRICAQLERRGIELDILMAPLPERTIRKVASSRNPNLPKTVALAAEEFEQGLPCARQVIGLTAEEWGLDVRHFVNRLATPDYNYGIWRSSQAYETHMQGLSRREKFSIYDPNHLNPVGARLFTNRLIDAIFESTDESPSSLLVLESEAAA